MIAEQLAFIEPSVDGELSYYPVEAQLASGEWRDCVYLAEAEVWFRLWGVWPQNDPGKSALDVSQLAAVRDSPTRLPKRFADQLYAAGESGMGYCVFVVVFSDGSSLPVVTGNALDFVPYPPGKTGADVVEVRPHQGRDDPRPAPPCTWCLFSRR